MRVVSVVLLLVLSACRNSVGEGEGEGEGEGDACPGAPRAGLRIEVLDDTNLAAPVPLCDCNVRAEDADFSETLALVPADCVFEGAVERAGAYLMTVAKAGYDTFTSPSPTVVSADATEPCHVVTRRVQLSVHQQP